MWNLVKLIDDDIIDLIPERWIMDQEHCFYPDCKISTVKLLAKTNGLPQEDWDVLSIAIIESNIGKKQLFILFLSNL